MKNIIKKMNRPPGFTLVELLIVIAVIAILASVAFVAIDPATRINDAQNSERWSAVNAVMDAFLEYTIDNDGDYVTGVAADGAVHQIASTTDPSCSLCSATQCTDFDDLATGGYIAALPVDPDTFAEGTGYTLSVATNGIITVTSCGAENETISIAR